MHDLDRSDLVFEADNFDEELEQFEDDDGSQDELADEEEEGVFDGEESELAGELLSVTDDHELDQFLGDLLKRTVRRFQRPLGRALSGNLGSLLKGAVKKVLPTVATMAGGAFGGPAGAMIANRATPYLSGMLGMELEGLSPEDQEFEAAKQLVRMAGSAIENAAKLAATTPAASAARQAVIDAARKHVPGLVRNAGHGSSRGAQQGTWYRRGNRIVIVGV